MEKTNLLHTATKSTQIKGFTFCRPVLEGEGAARFSTTFRRLDLEVEGAAKGGGSQLGRLGREESAVLAAVCRLVLFIGGDLDFGDLIFITPLLTAV